MSEELFQTSLDAIDRAQARTLRLMCRGLLLENRASIAEIRALKARIEELERNLEVMESNFERRGVLLLAAHELLKRIDNSNYRDALSMTAFYDGTDCDGGCLIEDIETELEVEE